MVTPAKNLWHCFGCRHRGRADRLGDARRTACQLPPRGGVAARSDLSLAAGDAERRCSKRSRVRKLPAPVALDADDAGAAQPGDRLLPRDAASRAPRRWPIWSSAASTIARADRALPAGLCEPHAGPAPAGQAREGRRRDAQPACRSIGVLRDTGHEHFNGSLVDADVRRSAATSPRSTAARSRDACVPGTPLHLYLPGPHRGVWNVRRAAASKEIILCEALIDALTFWCAGYRNVTAAYGVEGFTDDHLAAFKRYGTRARADRLRPRRRRRARRRRSSPSG